MDIMDILYSLPKPKLLIELIIERGKLDKDRKEIQRTYWSDDEEGKALFDSLKTPAERTLFFYEHLLRLKNISTDIGISKSNVYKLAYIMANVISGSTIEFGGYPDILYEEKNIIVKCVRVFGKDESVSSSALGALMLEKVSGVTNSLDFESKPYNGLTRCDKNGDFSDQYKLERYMMGTLCTDDESERITPYIYDIELSNIKSNDESSEDDTDME